jgi:hypothetical protein
LASITSCLVCAAVSRALSKICEFLSWSQLTFSRSFYFAEALHQERKESDGESDEESDEEQSDNDKIVLADHDQEEETIMAPAKIPATPQKKPPPSPKPLSNMSPLNHGAGKESECCGKLSLFSLWVSFGFADGWLLSSSFHLSGTTVTVADLEHPEQNGELCIQPFWNVEQKGILHNSILIEANCDPWDFMAGKFKARLDPTSANEVFIEVPSSMLKQTW